MITGRVTKAILGFAFCFFMVGFEPELGVAQQKDRHGDLLPAAAVQRFGTIRFRHGSRIQVLAYSPDGKLLAAGGGTDPIRLWNAESGAPVRRLQQSWVAALAFSPDGNMLAAGGGFRDIRIWNVQTGQQIHSFTGHTDTVTALAFSADQRFLVSASADHTVGIWDVPNRRLLHQLKLDDEVTCVAIAPDGQTLAAGSLDYTVRLFQLTTGQPLQTCTQEDGVYCVAFLNGGKQLASTGADGRIYLWDGQNGRNIHKWKAADDIIMSLIPIEEGKRFLVGSYKGTLQICEGDSAKPVGTFALHPGDADAVALAPDGKTVACAGRNHTIRLFDAASNKEKKIASGPKGSIVSMRRSPDGQWLALADSTDCIRVLNATTLEQKYQWHFPCGGNILVAFAADGKRLLAITGTKARLLNLATGKEEKRGFQMPDDDPALCLTCSPDGALLAVAHQQAGVRVLDFKTGKVRQKIAVKGRVQALAFSPDSDILAGGGLMGVILWEPTRGTTIRHCSRKVPATAVAFSPDGTILASGHFDGSIRLWDPRVNSEPQVCQGHQSAVLAIAFSPTGRTLTSGSFDQSARQWETVSGKPIATWKPSHTGAMNQVVMSADGRRAFSGSADTTVLAWDVTGFSPDGKLPVLNLQPGQLEQLWNELAAKKAQTGNRAVWNLIAGGKEVIKFLHKRVYLPDRASVEKLIKDLNANRFAIREKASLQLAGYGQWIRGRLEEAAKKPASLEAKIRLDALLEKLKKEGAVTIEQERFRLKRVMEVLEQTNTPSARKLLLHMSRGAVETAIADEAQASLKRLERK